MWKAVAFIDGAWTQINAIPVEGEPFSSERIRGLARQHFGSAYAGLLPHLDQEAETNGGLSRDAIELWARAAEAESAEFDWASTSKIKAVEEALALYLDSDSDGGMPVKPDTLAWHDRTAVIIPLTGIEQQIVIEYEPVLRDENRIARFRHRYGSSDHTLETILDWRGYFGAQSAVIDGWVTMHRAGHGFIASIKGTVGFVVGSVLRRLTRSAPTLERDPTAARRLIDMSERYPQVAYDCPDLSRIDPVRHDCAIIFVHGTVSCGIQGLKELYQGTRASLFPPLYRYEHDTFRPLDENASELAELIRGRIRANRILIAAHSRGGLVARLALDDLLRDGYPGQIEVATFGTPHLGTPLVEVGGRALNLLYKLGEDIVGSIPLMTPLTKAYSYVIDSPTLPRGIDVMREHSDTMDLLRRLDDAGRVRSWGSDFDEKTGPSGFGVTVEGALLGALGDRRHDLVVPTDSALGFGTPEPVLNCSHVHYFSQPAVWQAIMNFCPPPPAVPPGFAPMPPTAAGIQLFPDYLVIGGIRVSRRRT